MLVKELVEASSTVEDVERRLLSAQVFNDKDS
jgi:hypothetical protein